MSAASAARPSPQEPVDAPWHGPASLLGVALGLALWALPYVAPRDTVSLLVWLVPPLAGVVLLAVRGPARRLGVGLLASCLALPVTLLWLTLLSPLAT